MNFNYSNKKLLYYEKIHSIIRKLPLRDSREFDNLRYWTLI